MPVPRSRWGRWLVFRQRRRGDILRDLDQELMLQDALKTWATTAELRAWIFEYVEKFYNTIRLHSTLGMRSPAELWSDHDAGDSDGLARTSAGARKNSVHNFQLRTAITTTSTCDVPPV
jgi:Integrase core domain